MIRLALIIALFPSIGLAQQAWVDQPYIRSCFAQALPGETAPACLGEAAAACQTAPGNGSTLGIAQCIQSETDVWDALLNEQYQARRAELAAQDPGLPDQLRDAQRAWIAYRDAECGLRFALWSGGTIRMIIGSNCLLTETAERALELRDLGRVE